MDEKKYLGIDWGEERIGLALGDSIVKTATPFKTVKNIDEIIEVIVGEEIDELVVGAPVGLDGGNNYSLSYKEFIVQLKNIVKKPIAFVDERLSSKQADVLREGKGVKASRDEVAAMIILQSFFDAK